MTYGGYNVGMAPTSLDRVSFQQPVENFLLSQSGLDLSQPPGFLQRSIHLTRVGIPLLRELRDSIVEVRFGRLESFALGDRVDDQVTPDLPLGELPELPGKALALL